MENTLITGAGGGVGRALCARLHERGATLHATTRDPGHQADLASNFKATVSTYDALDNHSTLEAAIKAAAAEQPLTGIANCIGSIHLKPAHNTSFEDWNHTLRTNLDSAFACVKFGAKAMLKTGGSIVLVSTAAAAIGLPNHEAISAAKGGIEAMARSAAATYGKYNIRVNVVAPGLTRTPLTERITGNEAMLKASTAMHALGRIGEADEVAAAIAFLLDPENSWITGQVLGVDGGLGSVRR